MGAGSWESHHAITALMFRYAECVDAADFDGIAALFAHGRITNEGVEGAIVGPDAVRKLYERTNRVHDDGTTRTRHVNTQRVVDIDEDAGTRVGPLRRSSCSSRPPRCRSNRSSAAATATRSCAPAREWHFDCRHIIVDHVGDVREHLTFDLSSFVEEH